MIVNVELSEEVEARLRADAQAQGTEPETLLLRMIGEFYGVGEAEENPDSVEEIRQALTETGEYLAQGERGLSVEEAFDELEQRAEVRRSRHLQKAA